MAANGARDGSIHCVRPLAALLAFVLAALLTGCGGGGGGDTGGSTPPAATAPAITTQPGDATVAGGATASFTVVASGSTPAYQWQTSTDGSTWTPVAGATGATLDLGTVTAADNGHLYRVIVSNSAGSVTSTAATLRVTAATGFTALPASLGVPRTNHTATLLPDGTVLFTGGDAGAPTGQTHGLSHATAELFDPVAGSFSAVAGSMSVVREGHAATLLPDGTVLITGGFDNQGSDIGYASAEIYDPATHSFSTLTATMTVPRSYHSATLLPDGKVLIAGGTTAPSAELYDPVARSFTALPAAMTSLREAHSATLLGNGKVLIAGGATRPGGSGAFTAQVSAELFDPATRTFTALAAAPTTARVRHTATRLPDGRVLLAGGINQTATDWLGTTSAEVYDPAGGSFSALAATLTGARAEHTATLLPDGRVLFTGGMTGYNSGSVLRSAETYAAPATTATFAGAGATLPAARAGHTATLLPDGKVLVTGGVAVATLPAPALASALIYDPVAKTSTPLTATLRVPRISHTATLLRNGLVLITGGQVTDNDGDGSNSAELYDPATQTFTLLPATMVSPRGEHSATLLPDGKVLLAAGFNGGPGTLVSDAELYDPVARSFSAIAGRMVSTSGRQAAALLPNGKVLLAGGSSSNAAQIYDPATRGFSALAATMSANRAAATATLLPSGKVLIAGGGTFVSADLASSVTLDSAELFDPVAGTFSALTARMTVPRLMHAATLLPDGSVLFTGGGRVGGTSTPAAPWAVYDGIERYGP